MAEAGASVAGRGSFGTPGVIRVRNLGPAQRVVLRGIDVIQVEDVGERVVAVENCQGPVWLEDCRFAPEPLVLHLATLSRFRRARCPSSSSGPAPR